MSESKKIGTFHEGKYTPKSGQKSRNASILAVLTELVPAVGTTDTLASKTMMSLVLAVVYCTKAERLPPSAVSVVVVMMFVIRACPEPEIVAGVLFVRASVTVTVRFAAYVAAL